MPRLHYISLTECRKKFTFCLKGLPTFCIVLYILAISVGQKAFRDNFTSIQDIFGLKVPAYRDVLHVGWNDEALARPFLCNVRHMTQGSTTWPRKSCSRWRKHRRQHGSSALSFLPSLLTVPSATNISLHPPSLPHNVDSLAQEPIWGAERLHWLRAAPR